MNFMLPSTLNRNGLHVAIIMDGNGRWALGRGLSRSAGHRAGLQALRTHALDAFVYDKPLLAWIIHTQFASSVELIDTTFETQEYAIALPTNSPLAKPLNVGILQAVEGDWWQPTVFRYIGSQ